VDDEPSVRMIARAILAGAGYAVTEAAEPAAARAAVQSAAAPFDLIFLDLSLPGESGTVLIPEFRAQSPGSRILLVSGLNAEDVTGHGADAFLSKPFTRATLLDAVQRLLADA
jgi:CheY-like chemotaxis protein